MSKIRSLTQYRAEKFASAIDDQDVKVVNGAPEPRRYQPALPAYSTLLGLDQDQPLPRPAKPPQKPNPKTKAVKTKTKPVVSRFRGLRLTSSTLALAVAVLVVGVLAVAAVVVGKQFSTHQPVVVVSETPVQPVPPPVVARPPASAPEVPSGEAVPDIQPVVYPDVRHIDDGVVKRPVPAQTAQATLPADSGAVAEPDAPTAAHLDQPQPSANNPLVIKVHRPQP